MYFKTRLINTVRVPPDLLGCELDLVIKDLLCESLEGRINKKLGMIVVIINLVEIGEGKILTGEDGLVHVSQISDDFISYDEKNGRLVCRESNRAISVGDGLMARIVAVSLNETDPGESKIGLTMRQPALGKFEWIEEDRRRAESD